MFGFVADCFTANRGINNMMFSTKDKDNATIILQTVPTYTEPDGGTVIVIVPTLMVNTYLERTRSWQKG